MASGMSHPVPSSSLKQEHTHPSYHGSIMENYFNHANQVYINFRVTKMIPLNNQA